MSVEWPFTRLGLTFFEGTLPKLVRALERIAVVMEKEQLEASAKPSISPLQDKVDERVRRIDTVRKALLAAANISREESRDMTTQEVADDVLNQLTEGEFDAE